MKISSIIATLCLLAVVSCCLGAEEANRNQSLVAKNKLFDFARFKSLFNKRYSSLAEEIARERIFLGNAFRAFLSLVRYKARKVGMYLKIHDKSDWTNEELRKMEGRRTNDNPTLPAPPKRSQEVADLNQIESELKQLVANKDGNPAIEKFAKELVGSPGSSVARRKREAGNKRESLSIDDLFRVPRRKESAVREKIPSNNKHYAPPELESFGLDDNRDQPPMTGWLSVGLPDITNIRNRLAEAVSSITGRYSAQSERIKNVIPISDLPDEVFVDHRTSGCWDKPKSQGQCGSCFIFSTTALYEWSFCRETGYKAVLSEQYPMDCGERIGIQGCVGGYETQVSEFYDKFGIELDMNYPYREHVDSCPYNQEESEKRMGYLRITGNPLRYIDKDLFDTYIRFTPIVIGMGVSDEFHHYGSGVDMGEYCDERRGHSMLIVGAGREDGVEYWLIRNSYGDWWGDEGHYKIAKHADHCFINGYYGAVLYPDEGRVFPSIRNPIYDGAAVWDRLEHYVPSPQKQLDIESLFMVTPPPR